VSSEPRNVQRIEAVDDGGHSISRRKLSIEAPHNGNPIKSNEPERNRAVRSHKQSVGYWWAIFVGLVMIILGLPVLGGGVWLLTLGGTWYYSVAGVGLIASGILIARRQMAGVWLYLATWLVTICWAYSEVQFNGWP